MPRAGKGGARQGAVGQSYGNRSDLNSSMPVETAKNQAYGVAAQQRAAQNAIPVAAQPVPGASSGAAPAMSAPQQATGPSMIYPQQSASAPQMPPMQPGSLSWMNDTERPFEPVTAGVDGGPGPGPEVLGRGMNSLADILRMAAMSADADPHLLDLAHAAQVMGR